MPNADHELSREEALDRLAAADRALDRGDSPSWSEMIWIVQAAIHGVKHGYVPVVGDES